MKKAFTLAEVLIALVVIAVVAAMTIPAIIHNYKYKLYAASIEKTYSQISDATHAAMADEYSSNFFETTSGVHNDCTNGAERGPCYFLKTYFSVAYECSGYQDAKCVSSDGYKSFAGADAGTAFGQKCIKNTNGATICATLTESGDYVIFVDTNGPAAPNTTGLDVFVIWVEADGNIRDWLADTTKCNTQINSDGHVGDYASGCLSKVMNNGWVITD